MLALLLLLLLLGELEEVGGRGLLAWLLLSGGWICGGLLGERLGWLLSRGLWGQISLDVSRDALRGMIHDMRVRQEGSCLQS